MKLYSDLASYWPLFSSPDDYAEEAGIYARLLSENGHQPIRNLLELGSGGGNNASHLKNRFELTLVDVSEQMLVVSRKLNPECRHVQGDMRTVRLDREFDAVFIHDAVEYMTTDRDLRAAIETAFIHCKPQGVALFIPDFVRETFQPGMSSGGHDGTERSVRYLEWTWDPDPGDSTYLVDFAIVLRDRDDTIRVEHDRHVCGLFSEATWIKYLSIAGFAAQSVSLNYSDTRPGKGFLARRRS